MNGYLDLRAKIQLQEDAQIFQSLSIEMVSRQFIHVSSCSDRSLREIPGIVSSGAPVMGDKKSIGTPTGLKRLLKYPLIKSHGTIARHCTYVALSRYLGEMFSIGMITIELNFLICMTSRTNHSRYTFSLVTAVSLSASVIVAERSLII